MSIVLMLRALRKCEQLRRTIEDCHCQACTRHRNFANKLHDKIVERVERMMKAGHELCVDKLVREAEEDLQHLREEI